MSSIQHQPVQAMSADQAKAFPQADYVIAVTLPRDAQGQPAVDGALVVAVHAGARLKIAAELNLAGKAELPPSAQPVKLMPAAGEIMKIVTPDGTATYCTNVPVWKWVGLTMSQF